jgi:energy-coupling factor transport system permease protein
MLAAGVVMLVGSFSFAGSQSVRTRYRPDPWRAPEWLVVGCGAVALGVLIAAATLGVDGLRPTFSPLAVPAVPLLPTAGILVAALPAFLTPSLPVTR